MVAAKGALKAMGGKDSSLQALYRVTTEEISELVQSMVTASSPEVIARVNWIQEGLKQFMEDNEGNPDRTLLTLERVTRELRDFREEHSERPSSVYGWFATTLGILGEGYSRAMVGLGSVAGIATAGVARDIALQARGSYAGEQHCKDMLEMLRALVASEKAKKYRALVKAAREMELYALEMASEDETRREFFLMQHYFLERFQLVLAASMQLEALESGLREFVEVFRRQRSLPEELLGEVGKAAKAIGKTWRCEDDC